jgi:hypothetical protein
MGFCEALPDESLERRTALVTWNSQGIDRRGGERGGTRTRAVGQGSRSRTLHPTPSNHVRGLSGELHGSVLALLLRSGMSRSPQLACAPSLISVLAKPIPMGCAKSACTPQAHRFVVGDRDVAVVSHCKKVSASPEWFGQRLRRGKGCARGGPWCDGHRARRGSSKPSASRVV